MRLRELRGMLTEPETAGVTIQKMLMVTITEVFKDILPDYRIRPWTEKEKAVKVSTASREGDRVGYVVFCSQNIFTVRI